VSVDPTTADDAALVREIVAGSADALAAIYDRYGSSVYAAAARLTSDRQLAEDVVQETFLALWNRAETFDPTAGSLPPWLHAIARNRAIDRLRAASRRPRLVSISSLGPPHEADASAFDRLLNGAAIAGPVREMGPEEALAAVELHGSIRAALSGIPDEERTVILLAYREQLTQVEIAERLGWPLGTVKTRTRRALLRLRSALSDDPDAAPTGPVAPFTVPTGEGT
jgi:RNA polymerase sigma-70 factor (ECF subfamily)